MHVYKWHYVMQKPKRGRKPSPFPTEQVTVRLPKLWIDQFRRRGVSNEIHARLAASFHFDQAEPNFRKLAFQIERLAMDIERSMGAPWYADEKAFEVFQETLRLALRDLPKPTAQKSTIKADASAAAQLIYQRYLSIVRDWERGVEPQMRTSLSHILENQEKDDG
jgi:hypothetical protein